MRKDQVPEFRFASVPMDFSHARPRAQTKGKLTTEDGVATLGGMRFPSARRASVGFIAGYREKRGDEKRPGSNRKCSSMSRPFADFNQLNS